MHVRFRFDNEFIGWRFPILILLPCTQLLCRKVFEVGPMLDNPSVSSTPVQQTKTTGAFFEAICGSFVWLIQLIDPLCSTILPRDFQLDCDHCWE